MGYRSEVGFVVPENAPRFEKLDEDADCFDSIRDADGYRLYVAEQIKWYEGDNVVDAVEEYVREHEDDCLFVRIGESDDDLEVIGHLWENPFNLGYVRELRFDESV